LASFFVPMSVPRFSCHPVPKWSAREGGQRGGGGGGEETHEKELANVSASQRDLRLLCGGDGVGKGSAARADCF
jgi:hypothetical protein